MILNRLAQAASRRVQGQKMQISALQMRRLAEEKAAGEVFTFPFEKALKEPGMSFICEVKKASPSKGLIASDFPYLQIAQEYEQAGAAAVSCLTEPDYFLGKDSYLKEIAAAVQIPVLRKDFTVDDYMIFQAKMLGASAILLICAILCPVQLKEYLLAADSLGLSALVEAHDAREVDMALQAGARIVGVNNRDLRDFTVDIENSVRLREMIPDHVIYVSESGIRTAADVGRLYRNGTDAVLIGETLMRSTNKKEALTELRRECHA